MGTFNSTLSACSGALSCGSTMATYNGVAAKSNGVDQCTGNCCGGSITTGCAYQCVEYAQRYFNTKYGTAPKWGVNANQMCSSYPNGVKKTNSPQPGDLWVRTTGTYGHVAVISAVHSSTVDVYEQNSAVSGRNTYNIADAGCFLTGGAVTYSCPNKGYYCGNNGLGKDPNNLYYCSAAGSTTPTLATDCGFTCTIMPHGYDDKCVSGSCANTYGPGGNYCGNDKIGGDANSLYRCENYLPKGAAYCSGGCATAPAGTNDYCK